MSAIPYIVPFYKNHAQLDRCVAALRQQEEPTREWIWDNSDTNIYCCAAFNKGIKAMASRGHEFIILGTQDIYLLPDCVGQMLKFMQSHDRCAIVGIKQLLDANPDIIVHGGGKQAYPHGEHYGGKVSQNDCATSRKMPWVNGSCTMLRTAAIQEIGLLDENMKMLGIDSDICYTARARRWEVWYCAEAHALHEVGVSAKTAPTPELGQIFANDMAYWRRKWIGSGLYAELAGEFL